MTTIDTNYLLDEIKLQGELIKLLFKSRGLPRLPNGAVPLMTEKDHERIEALLEEMEGREAMRQQTRTYLTPRNNRNSTWQEAPVTLGNIDELVASLRVLPDVVSMRTILVSAQIELSAKHRNIDQLLVHTAFSGDPKSVPWWNRTPTEEELEEFWPKLPEPVKSEWAAYVADLKESYSKKEIGEMVGAYAIYLERVLKRYAAEDSMKGVEWHYGAEISINPKYVGSKSFLAASQTISGEPHNPPFIIKIKFEPGKLAELRRTGWIDVFKDTELEIVRANNIFDSSLCVMHNSAPLGMVSGSIPIGTFVASYRTQTDAWMGFGRSPTEALLDLIEFSELENKPNIQEIK